MGLACKALNASPIDISPSPAYLFLTTQVACLLVVMLPVYFTTKAADERQTEARTWPEGEAWLRGELGSGGLGRAWPSLSPLASMPQNAQGSGL